MSRIAHWSAEVAAGILPLVSGFGRPPETKPGLLRRGWRTWRSEGTRALVMHALGMGLHRRLLFFERDVYHDPRSRMPDVPLTLERLADPAELLTLRPDASLDVIERQVRTGARVLAARHQGRLVSVRWIAFERVHMEYLDRVLLLAPHECYHFDSYTDPAYRRMHINAEMSEFSQREAREAGCTTSIGCALPENTVATKVLQHSGYRITGRIGWTGIGPLRRYFAEREGAPLRWAPR